MITHHRWGSKKSWAAAFCVAVSASTWAATDHWVLESGSLTYHVTHKFHRVEGTSRTPRGKGVCDESGCRFLTAATVASFVSGDTNRDLHMMETTRGAEFPVVTVACNFPSLPSEKQLVADLTIEFAGQRHTYKAVSLTIDDVLGKKRVQGSVPLNIDDFKIPAPSLFGLDIQHLVPLEVDLTWTRP